MRLERSLLPLLALIPLAGCVTTRPQSARPLITVETPALADPSLPTEYADHLRSSLLGALIDTEQFTVLVNDRSTETMPLEEGLPETTRDHILAGSPADARFAVIVTATEIAQRPYTPRVTLRSNDGPPPQEAVVSLRVEIINTENRTILDAGLVTGRHALEASDIGVTQALLQPSSAAARSSALGRATREAVQEATTLIARAIPEAPWTPMIAAVMPGEIVINGGHDRGVRVDDRYQLFRQAEHVRDPETGQLIGVRVGESMGLLRVIEVGPRHAVCELPSGWQVEPGMVLRPREVRTREQWYQRLLP